MRRPDRVDVVVACTAGPLVVRLVAYVVDVARLVRAYRRWGLL